MEAQEQGAALPIISHQHGNGELLQAASMEAARAVCPFLGRLSLEEISLLDELKVMGSEQPAMTVESTVRAREHMGNRPAKIDQRQPEQYKTADTTEPLVPARENSEIESLRSVPVPALSEAKNIPVAVSGDGESGRPAKLQDGSAELLFAGQVYEPNRYFDRPPGDERAEPSRIAASGKAIEADEPPQASVMSPLPVESVPERTPWLLSAENTHDDERAEAAEPGVLSAVTASEEIILPMDEGADPAEQTLAQQSTVEVAPEAGVPVELPMDQKAAGVPALTETMTIAIERLDALVKAPAEAFTQKMHEVIEQILAVPQSVERQTAATTDGSVEELEVLFLEFFEEAGMADAPDMARLCVDLTRSLHWVAEPQPEHESEAAEDAASLPDELGTREFLQKLQRALQNAKDAAARIYAVGKSAIHLYARQAAILFEPPRSDTANVLAYGPTNFTWLSMIDNARTLLGV